MARTKRPQYFEPQTFRMMLKNGELTREEWIHQHEGRIHKLELALKRYDELFLYGREPITQSMRTGYIDHFQKSIELVLHHMRGPNQAGPTSPYQSRH